MILDDIVARRKAAVEEVKAFRPLTHLQREISETDTPRRFYEHVNQEAINVICEIKKASPSKGDIRMDADVPGIAREYSNAGAAAISCLTEPDYFKGRNEYIQIIKRNCPLPVLRKDFIVDPYQVYESRLLGADAILLIVHILSREELTAMLEICESLSMSALVETHSKDEIETALEAGAQIIGINNRDLTTMKIDLNTTFRLLPRIPQERTVVVESGITEPQQVRRLVRAGARNFLVGTALMANRDIAKTFQELFGTYSGETACPF